MYTRLNSRDNFSVFLRLASLRKRGDELGKVKPFLFVVWSNICAVLLWAYFPHLREDILIYSHLQVGHRLLPFIFSYFPSLTLIFPH